MVRSLITAVLGLLLCAVCTQPAFADCGVNESCWGASAAGTWNDSNGSAHVAIGSAVNYSSKIGAQNGAMSECNDGGYNCEVVGTFKNGGCGYITTGSNYDGVHWNSGSDIDEVYAQCVRAGYSCDWPIGACTAER